jgi:hypothetical protein
MRVLITLVYAVITLVRVEITLAKQKLYIIVYDTFKRNMKKYIIADLFFLVKGVISPITPPMNPRLRLLLDRQQGFLLYLFFELSATEMKTNQMTAVSLQIQFVLFF